MKKVLTWLMLAAMAAGSVQAAPTASLSGDEIRALESRLNALGYIAEADDIYDENTVTALTAFQQANGLNVTGEADEPTIVLINSAEAVTRRGYLEAFAQKYASALPFSKGNIGQEVADFQRELRDLGYFNFECDGVFGDATQAAVEHFQLANGLNVTGVIDGTTQLRLFEGNPVSWDRYLEDLYTDAGDSGLNVYILQKKLSAMGYFNGDHSGSFGDVTKQAVSDFQSRNGLEPTGIADAGTWRKIYSNDVVTLKKEYALQLGDFGETVQRIQQRLTDLGFYTREITGTFGPATETAVRLFQMACGLEVTGEVEESTIACLNDANPKSLKDENVQKLFAGMIENWDYERFYDMARHAHSLLGTEFIETEDALYPGFAFVQYICVSAGLPIARPEDLIALTDFRVEPDEELPAGNVVAFQTASGDSVKILLTISIDENRLIYATADGNWVVLSYLDQMDTTNVYRWGDATEATE